MSDEKTATQIMDELLCNQFLLGEWAATERIANQFLQRAGEEFALGHDALARASRDRGKMLAVQAAELRKRYDEARAAEPTWGCLAEALDRGGWE